MNDSQRDLAVHFVVHGTMPIAEIARRVGYVNAGAFARAFRKWTGRSPTDYRAHGPAVAGVWTAEDPDRGAARV